MTGATPIEKPINNVVSKNCVYIIIVIEATPFTPNKFIIVRLKKNVVIALQHLSCFCSRDKR